MDNNKSLTNNTSIDSAKTIQELNINYDLIKQELDSISDKVERIEDKRYFYKDNGKTLFAIEDTKENTINVFYKVDHHATLTVLENRVGVLTLSKDFIVFNRDQETGNLLYSSIDAAFLDLKVIKGRYKKVLEHSVISAYLSDDFLKNYFNSNPNAIDSLDTIYHNSTDGYICKIGDVDLSIKKITKQDIEVGLNVLCFNEDTNSLGKVECPVYKYYRKKREWNYSHKAGRKIANSTENMRNCNFDDYSFSKDIGNKYKELFDSTSNGKLLR